MVIYLDYVDWGTNIVTKRAREALVLSVIFGSLSFLRISALRTLRLRPALCDTRLKVGKSMYDSNGNVIPSVPWYQSNLSLTNSEQDPCRIVLESSMHQSGNRIRHL
jgi:hypothetical protein